MIQRRPILWATAPVVPEPAKESRTRSPGLVASSKQRLINFSGFFPFRKVTFPSFAIPSHAISFQILVSSAVADSFPSISATFFL